MDNGVMEHECDLFMMSSHSIYDANRSLLQFARAGQRNKSGWGVGYFIDQKAQIIKSGNPAMIGNEADASFQMISEAIYGKVILGHLRNATRGAVRTENSHPFRLNFLGYDWLLIHNGTAAKRDLVDHNRQLLVESDCDSARVFEFLAWNMEEYCAGGPEKSLIEGARYAYAKLLNTDPNGKYNIILSNGNITFAFIQWRTFYYLHRTKTDGDAVLLTTAPYDAQGEWVKFDRQANKKAKMLVFNGCTLVLNGDVPK